MNVAIIGGGAAGFFAALTLKELDSDINVTIFEKSNKLLSKVAVSGGGRCNVTNSFYNVTDLSKIYPRGDKLLKKAFKVFNHTHTCEWFETRGVPLITQDDDCIFPRSQNSQSIIDCFLELVTRYGVVIKRSHGVRSLAMQSDKIEVQFIDDKNRSTCFDKVIVTTGGSPRREGLSYLEQLGHDIEEPVPSLFTFNIPDSALRELMGTVVENTTVSLQGTKLKASGALLVTHWGMSGPVILKLSSYAARFLHEADYRATILVNWVNEVNNEKVTSYLDSLVYQYPHRQVSGIRPYDLPSRLWLMLLERAGIPENRRWNELGKKGINKLMNTLCNNSYQVQGKSAFRDEFVTCGGISLKSVNPSTMESRACPNLYFAGEVLDIDAVTGGFNFQAAWTTACVAARSIASAGKT